MKRIYSLLFAFLTMFIFNTALQAQNNAGITIEAFPRAAQDGPHNYFGARVTLDRTYDNDIVVYGTYNEDLDGNAGFELTVPAGQLTAETDALNCKLDPAASEVGITISQITPSTVSANGVTYCTQGFSGGCIIGEFSDEYTKKHVALIDTYVKSISTSEYVKRMYFKNFGSEQLPPVVGYSTDLFFDDGSHNDDVSGDGIYTSMNAYAHTSSITYTNGRDVTAIGSDHSVIDSSFEHTTELQTFLQTYPIPTRDDISQSVTAPNYFVSTSYINSDRPSLMVNDYFTMPDVKQYESFSTSLEKGGITIGSNDVDYLLKLKATLTCKLGSCTCACGCNACSYTWGKRLNWCFHIKECEFEIGWD